MSSGAGSAGAEHLDGVADLGEAVLGRHGGGPFLDGWAGHLLGATALAADEVVMVVLDRAPAVGGLAVTGAQDVHLAGVGERLQVAVDGRQADALALRPELLVQGLRAGETVRP